MVLIAEDFAGMIREKVQWFEPANFAEAGKGEKPERIATQMVSIILGRVRPASLEREIIE